MKNLFSVLYALKKDETLEYVVSMQSQNFFPLERTCIEE